MGLEFSSERWAWPWDDEEAFASKDFDVLGLRGSGDAPVGASAPPERPMGLELTWRWDKRRGMYLGKARWVPLPKPSKNR